ncbi:hypothetical protein [Ideonella sp.]|uniref:hypothetical protein n=1 Tax=Ideonella sp. TaxID=1929293 RepID=UPI002B4875C3|nr:hypothetical protein [Ideonella sp.]HJV70291.1 hypothetical protein [Ideonella sp.]
MTAAWLLRTAACALAVFAATGCDKVQADGSRLPPLRVVRAGHADLAGMKNSIELRYGGCLASLGRPIVPAPMPSDAVLASLVVHEEEEIFDGALWAKFEVDRAIGADPANHCQLAVFSSRSVQIDRTCENMLKGSNAPLAEMLSGAPAEAGDGDVQQSPWGAEDECRRQPPPLNIANLPRDDAGQGARCIWYSAIAARAGSLPPASDGSFDSCLYDKRPYHFFKGHGRPVELERRSDDRSLTGQHLPAVVAEIAAFGNLQLVSLSEGAAIPAERFTRPQAVAFLHQPTKSPLGSH